MQDLTLWSKLSAGRNLGTSLRVLEALLAFGSWMAFLVLSLASKRDSLCLVSPVIHFHVCLGGLIAVHKQNLIFLYRTVVEFEIFHLAKFYYQKTNTRWFLSTDVDIILDVRCFTMRKCAVSSPFCNRAHCQRRMHWPSGVLLWHLPLHVQNEWLSGSWVKMALKETHPSFVKEIHPSIQLSVAVESIVKMAPSFILHHWSTDTWLSAILTNLLPRCFGTLHQVAFLRLTSWQRSPTSQRRTWFLLPMAITSRWAWAWLYDGRPEHEKYEVFEVFVHFKLVFFEIQNT